MEVQILVEAVGMIAALLALGLFVHQVVEAVVAPFYDKIPALEPYKWTQIYWQFIVGCVVSFSLQLDALPAILSQFDIPAETTLVGLVLTGILIGGGSELWHKAFGQ